MVLVLNFFLQDHFAISFDRVVGGHLAASGEEAIFLRVKEDTTSDHVLEIAGTATHLILSGSEASTLDDHGWEEEMKKVVEHFMAESKPILGICYGHQFLVRCLAGKEHIRKASIPEMGWGTLVLEENPLFKGLTKPVSLLSHYDEVANLPQDFRILGASSKCSVHAFQYKELPLWGVQFHPEYDVAAGNEIFADLKEKDPETYRRDFVDELEAEKRLEQNAKIFANFLGFNRENINNCQET